jgi:hypothetical protein
VLAFVQDIKQQYGLKHVFAWHATAGYWSGVSPAAAVVDAAAAAQAEGAGSAQAAAEARGAAAAEVVLPHVGPVMSDLEPPTNWSQLVRTVSCPCDEPVLPDMASIVRACVRARVRVRKLA